MATVNNCLIPEELHYLVERHVWVRWEGEGPLIVGITDVGRHLAGTIVAVTPKKPGRAVPRGASVATIESSKWVGPVPAPVSGEVVEVNEALRKNPTLINQDPYGAGWVVKLRPSRWEEERGDFVTGPEGITAYRAFLEREGIRCGPGTT
jgi:glycine cleavage system H protein